MAHIMRINEMESLKQFGVRHYMNANHPDVNTFRGDLSMFNYNGVWFYPVASRPATHRYNKIDHKIEYSEWCDKFSKSISYNYEDFYNIAKKYGYANCDVFVCKVDGAYHFLIPTNKILAEFPMYAALNYNDRNMNILRHAIDLNFI